MATQIFTHSQNELAEIVKNAVSQAFKEHRAAQKPDNTLLTQSEAKDLLKVSLPTLQKMKKSGLIPYSQINRKIYYRKQDILNSFQALANENKC